MIRPWSRTEGACGVAANAAVENARIANVTAYTTTVTGSGTDYPTVGSDVRGQPPACSNGFPGRTIGQLSAIEIHLNLAALEVPADELLSQGIFDIALNGAAQRSGSVRSILAGDVDDPIRHFGRQDDAHLAIHEVRIELLDQERQNLSQVLVGQRL